MTSSSASSEVLAQVAAGLVPVDLPTVLAHAGLQTRVDRKYLLEPAQFQMLAGRLGDSFRVLEIDGRRQFGYESVYFDTRELDLFRAHRQGQRLRYKARTRTYVESAECMFEVKLKGRRGETVKHRMPYDVRHRQQLNVEAARFLGDLLHEAYGKPVPVLQPVVTTAYSRATLVDLEAGARMTCDVDLVCFDDAASTRAADMVLVESKSSGSGSLADQVLREMHVRPIAISKYCIGIALLHRHLAANKWNRTLRREFGWVREPAVALS